MPGAETADAGAAGTRTAATASLAGTASLAATASPRAPESRVTGLRETEPHGGAMALSGSSRPPDPAIAWPVRYLVVWPLRLVAFVVVFPLRLAYELVRLVGRAVRRLLWDWFLVPVLTALWE
ncbi:hypothetical protein MXD95_010290, partial [Frankia sp. AiPa1]|nr:hypothetical protein [Frankia sp. AiPa1]